LIVLTGLVFVAFSAGEAPLLRFLASDAHDIGSDTRIAIWNASIRAWRLSPTLGSGLGTFREAFRRVQPRSIAGLVEQAHNDFLQMLVTGGWIGAALVTIGMATMLVLLVQVWLNQKHREESAFALAGIGALFSLILHGLVEFNMSIPAIPATLAVALGLAWAAGRYDGRGRERIADSR
jgi:O-antigen ligase